MDTTRIGYIICESGIVTGDCPDTRIIREDTVEAPDENGNASTHRRVVAETVLQTANIKNRNGRIYPSEELIPQLTTERTKTLIEHGMLCGEAGHPLDASLVRQQTIDPKFTMSRYLKLWNDGDFIWGQYKGTNNSYGAALDMDLREGYVPEFSLRALGSLDTTPRGNIVKNLKMITYDVVHYQSDPNAYTRKVLSEAYEIQSVGNTDKDVLAPLDRADIINYIMQESTNLKGIKESFDIDRDSIKYLPDINKVRMMDKNGSTLMINLESYISNEINDYVSRR